MLWNLGPLFQGDPSVGMAGPMPMPVPTPAAPVPPPVAGANAAATPVPGPVPMPAPRPTGLLDQVPMPMARPDNLGSDVAAKPEDSLLGRAGAALSGVKAPEGAKPQKIDSPRAPSPSQSIQQGGLEQLVQAMMSRPQMANSLGAMLGRQ